MRKLLPFRRKRKQISRSPLAQHFLKGRWSLDSLLIVPARYKFQVAKGKNAQFQAVKHHFQKADKIINACDIDLSL